MARRGGKRTAVLADVRRLIVPMDVLYAAGNLIYRRSLRYTLFTAGIGVVGLAAKRLGLPGFTVRQAIMLPLLIGALTLLVGAMLKLVPSLIASRLLTVAQAGDLNLMEDYRKGQAEEHLNALWDRAFQYECRIRLAAAPPADDGQAVAAAGRHIHCRRRPDETFAEAAARAKTGFFIRAHKALVSPLPQIQQMHLVGLDLRYLEDWRDGAYLDRSDTKLMEQFDGSSTLLAARAETGLTGLPCAALFGARRLAQRFWFLFVTRAVAIQVGSAVQRLNRRFDTDLFNSQMLLWPGTEDDPWLEQFDGARAEVLRLRRQAVRRVFGADFQTARRVLDRVLYGSFALATELRMRCDPDYCDGSLDYDVLGDLEAEGRSRRDLRRARTFVRRARSDLAAFGQFLAERRPDLLAPDRAENLRAARVALHTDRGHLKRLLRKGRAEGDEAAARRALAVVDQAAATAAACSHRLVAVRMHHEISRLARKGYERLVRHLAYDGGHDVQ